MNEWVSPTDNTEAVMTSASTNSFYRSSLLSSLYGINPLVACASPIFGIVNQIDEFVRSKEPSLLKGALVHEIQSYESTARHQNLSDRTIHIGRYFLCSLLDDRLASSDWGKEQLWEDHQLLGHFFQETGTGESFFSIIDELSKQPSQNQSLLELAYLCLSLGYEGTLRGEHNGFKQLTQMMNHLFDTIKEPSDHLTNHLWINPQLVKPASRKTMGNGLTWLFTGLTGLLVLGYLGFQYFLSVTAMPLYQHLLTINQSLSGTLT